MCDEKRIAAYDHSRDAYDSALLCVDCAELVDTGPAIMVGEEWG